MKINLKLRLKNKATLITLCVTVVAFIYQILAILGITPKVDENNIDTLITIVVGLMASLGIVVDPTTKGISDSDKAMTYNAPSDSDLDLSVVDNPIGDDNETVKVDEPKEDPTYSPGNIDAVKDVK